MLSSPLDILKSKKIEPDFKPSMRVLSRILQAMLEKGPRGKTCLAQDANLNYARLTKHIDWLEKKGFAESVTYDQKINLILTQKGRELSSLLVI